MDESIEFCLLPFQNNILFYFIFIKHCYAAKMDLLKISKVILQTKVVLKGNLSAPVGFW